MLNSMQSIEPIDWQQPELHVLGKLLAKPNPPLAEPY